MTLSNRAGLVSRFGGPAGGGVASSRGLVVARHFVSYLLLLRLPSDSAQHELQR